MTYRLTLEYDGTAFHGSQAQAAGKGRTIQGTLEAALARLTGTPVRVVLAGRTDAGVHARGQVASCNLPRPWDPLVLRRALNGVLPPDLAVREAAAAPTGFHARFDATARAYRYLIWNAPMASPLLRHVAWHVRPRLDLPAMQEAAGSLLGTQDFAAFSGAGWGVPDNAAEHSTIRTLTAMDLAVLPAGDPWTVHAGGPAADAEARLIAFDVVGNAFLPHMIRNLIGTLVEVGRGVLAPAGFRRILTNRDRRAAAATAPPQGLCLVRVGYAQPSDPGAGREREAEL